VAWSDVATESSLVEGWTVEAVRTSGCYRGVIAGIARLYEPGTIGRSRFVYGRVFVRMDQAEGYGELEGGLGDYGILVLGVTPSGL
jgi:hypothetical protein